MKESLIATMAGIITGVVITLTIVWLGITIWDYLNIPTMQISTSENGECVRVLPESKYSCANPPPKYLVEWVQ